MTREVALRGFPLLMARWDALHPYNAFHVVDVDGERDLAALERAAVETFREAGLGPVGLDLNGRSLALGDPVDTLSVEAVGGDLEAFAARELNLRFAPGALPIRFAASRGAGGTRLALTYWHPGGDGMGTAHLLRRILERLDGRAGNVPALEEPRLPRPGLLAPLHWSHMVVRLLERRRCFRPPLPGSLEVGCRIVDVPEDALKRLVDGARRRAATVGQLLLASLAAAVAAATPERKGRRRNLALASAVDLRPKEGPERWGTGVFEGIEDVVLPAGRDGSLEEALPVIRRQADAARRRWRTVQSLVEIDFANHFHPLVPLHERASYVTHRTALAAGLSNLKPPAAWFPDAARVRGYLRIVPVGPVVPLALAAATVAGRFSLTMTFRKSGYSPAQVEAIAAHLAATLRSL